jgi:hypothetical protein
MGHNTPDVGSIVMPKQWEEMTEAEKIEELHNDVKRIFTLLDQFHSVIEKSASDARSWLAEAEERVDYSPQTGVRGRKTLAYEWFRIVESSRLRRRTKSDDAAIADWQSWNIGFITQVRIESDRQYEIRVAAFPFFYELLKAFNDFFEKREFDVEVGEAVFFHGAPADSGFFEVNVFFGAGGEIWLSKRLRAADVLLFLILKTGELASSLEKIDVDLEYFFTKFPIGIYRRGIG